MAVQWLPVALGVFLLAEWAPLFLELLEYGLFADELGDPPATFCQVDPDRT